jgi:Spy/CpxP family protein refolding chaperone
MKRVLIGLTAAGLLAGGLTLAAAAEHSPKGGDSAAQECPMRDGRKHDCPKHDCPMHDSHGKHHGGPKGGRQGMMGGMGPMGDFGMMPGPGMLLGPLGDDLELTDEQRTKIKGLLEASQPGTDQLRDEMRSNGEQLAKIAPDDKDYDATVATTSRRMGELTTRMIQQRGALRAKVHAVLTPEQKTQLAERKTKMLERRNERREWREQRREHLHEGMGPGPMPQARPEAT